MGLARGGCERVEEQESTRLGAGLGVVIIVEVVKVFRVGADQGLLLRAMRLVRASGLARGSC